MQYYPICLDLRNRRAVVVGGGAVALQKARRLLSSGAQVLVVSPESDLELARLAREGELEWRQRPYRSGDLRGSALVIAATDQPVVQEAVAEEAAALGIPINVVDAPELSSFIAPAILDRGDLQVAVSTSGAAPALAAALRDRIGETLGPEVALVVEIVSKVRRRLRRGVLPPEERRRILKELAVSDLPDHVRRRDRQAVDRLLVEIGGSGITLESLGVAI